MWRAAVYGVWERLQKSIVKLMVLSAYVVSYLRLGYLSTKTSADEGSVLHGRRWKKEKMMVISVVIKRYGAIFDQHARGRRVGAARKEEGKEKAGNLFVHCIVAVSRCDGVEKNRARRRFDQFKERLWHSYGVDGVKKERRLLQMR
jgi:hypothetical protein